MTYLDTSQERNYYPQESAPTVPKLPSMLNGIDSEGIEKREHRRLSYPAEVEIEWGSTIERARTVNVSHGGMLVEMANPLWLGAEFHARLRLGNGPLEVDCVVKRIIAGTGIGVEFLAMKPADRERLRKLLDTLPY